MRSAGYLITALLFATSCSKGPQVDPPGRVLILGIDGATLEIIEPMIAEGKLPNLEALTRSGTWGPLRSLKPMLSPRIWTTVATGKSPDRHGVTGWATGQGEEQRIMNSHDRTVHALWNIASDAGLSVGTVNWLMTYPPEPIRGVMISDLAMPKAVQGREGLIGILTSGNDVSVPSGPTTYPVSWAESVAQIATEDRAPLTTISDPFQNDRIPKKARLLSDGAYRKDEELARVALDVEEQVRPDLMMVLLQGVDRTSHWLWAGLVSPEIYDPEVRFSEEEREASREVLFTYYEYTDQLIGRLLEGYGEDDLVIVLSDHGFEGGSTGFFRMSGIHETEEAQDGVVFVRGPGIPAGKKLKPGRLSVLDITPTVLSWLGLPLAQDMEGRRAKFLRGSSQGSKIPTYETRTIPRMPLVESGAEGDVMDELRAIGYVK